MRVEEPLKSTEDHMAFVGDDDKTLPFLVAGVYPKQQEYRSLSTNDFGFVPRERNKWIDWCKQWFNFKYICKK